MAAMEHACIVCDGNRILPHHLPSDVRDPQPEALLSVENRLDAARRYQAPDSDREKIAILKALDEAEGNRTRAAAILGMGRTTLWQKLKAHGLDHHTP